MRPTAQAIEIAAIDGHRLSAWRAAPPHVPKGGIVVLHAVYGLTGHIGDVCARWAEAGYSAVAPALYDRLGANMVHDYDRAADGAKTQSLLTEAGVFADIAAAARATGLASVAVSGFCAGGTWAWRAGAALDFAAQVNFYGSNIPALIDLVPRCPAILHYGDNDHIVTVPQIAAIGARHPSVELHVYPGAGHGFENHEQASYSPAASALAWKRSVAFLDRQFRISPPG